MKLPQIILVEWKNRDSYPVMTTVDDHGNTNSIYVGSIRIYNDETILLANNYFDKTFKNIAVSCKGNILFITKERKPYQSEKGDRGWVIGDG